MRRHILLTGASGFIGSHVLRKIMRETDWTVTCPVSFKHKGVPERLTWAASGFFGTGGRVELIRCDLAAPISPSTAYLFGFPHTIINLASDTHPPRSVEQPVDFVHNNVDSMLYLLEYARTQSQLRMFLHLSTDAVYGPALGDQFHREWDPIIPSNPYAASKAAQEALAISYWRSYDLPVVIATTMNPIGEMQDLEKFVPSAIRKIMRGDMIQIHMNAAGVIGARYYIDVDDVAAALLYLIHETRPTRHDQHDRLDRWNISGVRPLNNAAVVDLIADGLAMDAKTEKITVDTAAMGHRYALDTSKLTAHGWTPQHDIVDTIYRTAKWTKDRPMWWAA